MTEEFSNHSQSPSVSSVGSFGRRITRMDKSASKGNQKKMYKNKVPAMMREENRDAIQYYLFHAKESDILEIEEA
jgi:hypothetical protein